MKTNSESSAAENETASAATNESDVQGMSSGAAMLIERMKTNPDDFKYGGRFYRVVDALKSVDQHFLSERDLLALRPAYELHILEALLTEWVYGEIFNPKVEEPTGARLYTQAMTLDSSGNLGIGTTPSSFFAAPVAPAFAVNPNAGNPIMTLGQTTLTESMLQQVKNKLGL